MPLSGMAAGRGSRFGGIKQLARGNGCRCAGRRGGRTGDCLAPPRTGGAPAARAAELCARRPVKVLAGGTAAWKAAGLPLETGMGPLASEPDDVALSARERPADRERYMREYLAWEIDLVNQIGRDEDCRFRLAPVA